MEATGKINIEQDADKLYDGTVKKYSATTRDKVTTNDSAVKDSLTAEGYEVYKKVLDELSKYTSQKAREAASANAMLLASHADRIANGMRQIVPKGIRRLIICVIGLGLAAMIMLAERF